MDRIIFRAGFREVCEVFFTAFDVDMNNFVDLRPHSIPCKTAEAVSCVLPPVKYTTFPDPQYSYSPTKVDCCPPRGPNYMTHYFNTPHHIHEDERNIFHQTPKYLRGRLAVSQKERTLGWGLSFTDRANLMPLLLASLLPSLMFGLIWSVLKQDIQSGFTVASFVATCVSLFAMYIMSRRG